MRRVNTRAYGNSWAYSKDEYGAYLSIGERQVVSHSQKIEEGLIVDLNSKNEVVGIEFLTYSLPPSSTQ